MGSIKITLETLYDLLRNEKKREDLQKLDETFFTDVVNYVREKKMLLESRKSDSSMFSSAEREKLEYELRSIKRILKELYEKREKKIIDIALNKSRTGSDIIDTSSMLHEEKDLYRLALQVMDNFRQRILFRLFEGELPHLSGSVSFPALDPIQQRKELLRAELQSAAAARQNVQKPLSPTITSPVNPLSVVPGSAPSAATPAPAPIPSPLPSSSPQVKIQFVHPTPSFVWKDLKVYGPFSAGDRTEIFPEVAELLVRKGRAVKV